MEFFVRITPEGAVSTESIENPDLDFYYNQIGCSSIETIPLAKTKYNDQIMILDEECLLKDDHKPNPIAMYLTHLPICGTVLIAKTGTRNGEPDIVGFSLSEVTATRMTLHVMLTRSKMFEESDNP